MNKRHKNPNVFYWRTPSGLQTKERLTFADERDLKTNDIEFSPSSNFKDNLSRNYVGIERTIIQMLFWNRWISIVPFQMKDNILYSYDDRVKLFSCNHLWIQGCVIESVYGKVSLQVKHTDCNRSYEWSNLLYIGVTIRIFIQNDS